MAGQKHLKTQLQFLTAKGFSVLDGLPENSLAEKITSIVLDSATGAFSPTISSWFHDLRKRIEALDTNVTKVVVFGGGTGLSNIIGGDPGE